MPLQSNCTMTFNSYEINDEGIKFNFVCLNPGAGQPTDYCIIISDSELSTISNTLQFKTLVQNKLQRKYRALNICTKLDQYIGQSLVI